MALVARRSLFSLGTALLAAAGGTGSHAETLVGGRRLALRSYDPVAYFTLGRPEKGEEAFSFAFDDAVYRFSTAEHRAMFVADPERYAPQYAGFCAAGVSKGIKIEPDPEAWAIVGGKLYVVALKAKIDEFKRDPSAFVGNADANWPLVRESAPKTPLR